MAQKMEFLFEDVAALRDPSTDVLRAWYERNAVSFALPARASLRHLYFSPDRRGERARDDAARALAQIAGAPLDAPIAESLGDPFMFQGYYGGRSSDEIARTLGPGFAQALFALAPGSWSGPIESGYGWHLVFVDSITASRTPALEEVEAEVRSAWVEEQREEVRARAFAVLRERYEVVLPEGPDAADLGSLRVTEFDRSGAPR
jgi:parvulin-like peptidyl-prolyl isomerase